MPDTTIYRGLMNAATQTPTDPGARLRALQQRMQARRQTQGLPTPQRPRITPRSPAPVGGGYDGSGINPSANLPRAQSPAVVQGMPPRPPVSGNTGIVPPHMQPQRQFNAPVMVPQQDMPSTPSGPPTQAPAAASMQAMPQRPPGMPTPGSGINPTVPGVTMPDAARAPRPTGGLMAALPYAQS